MTPVEALSNRLPRFHPARMPIQMPMMVAAMVAVPSRIRVHGTAAQITSQTGLPCDRRERVELQRVLQIVEELLPQWRLELLPQCRQVFGRDVAGALVPGERVARQQLEEEEVEDEDERRACRDRSAGVVRCTCQIPAARDGALDLGLGRPGPAHPR